MQTVLFPIEKVVQNRSFTTMSERAGLIIDRCNDINANNQVSQFKDKSLITDLKQMLAETRRKYENGQLPWQKKHSFTIDPINK